MNILLNLIDKAEALVSFCETNNIEVLLPIVDDSMKGFEGGKSFALTEQFEEHIAALKKALDGEAQ